MAVMNAKKLNKYLDSYEAKLERNKSKHTIVNYMSDLKLFVNWLENNEQTFIIENFTQDNFLDYVGYLKQKFAPATVKRRAVSLNEFMQFLNKTGCLRVAPFVDNKELMEYLPVIQKKKVRALTPADIKSIIEATENLMQECIIRLAYDTGCRVSEVVRAEWDHITFDGKHHSLTVLGKGKQGLTKQRTVRISSKTMAKLIELKESRNYNSTYIIESERTKKPISERRVNQIIDDLGEKCGLGDISSHVFRKSIATNLIKNGMPIEYVSSYLGHADINTTKNNYTDLESDLQEKVEQFYGEEI